MNRTPADVAAARADRKTRIERFYGALGFDPEQPPDLDRLETLAERVEDDVRIHVRAAKERFRRLRPYEIEGMRDAAIGLITGEAPMRAAEPAYYPVRHHAFELAAATRTRVEEPLILLGEPEFVIEAPSFDDLEIIPVGSPRVLAVTDHVETPIETPRATAAANEVSANDASAQPVPRAAENSAA